MSIQIVFNDDIVRGRDVIQLTQEAKKAMLLYDYLNAQISIGEFAELMGMPLIDARDWLHKRGVATSRKVRDPELAQALKRDQRDFLNSIEAV
ncbi:MAG: hypothetical protein ACE1ZS_00005 [Candidatus Poribacteria bacterium]